MNPGGDWFVPVLLADLKPAEHSRARNYLMSLWVKGQYVSLHMVGESEDTAGPSQSQNHDASVTLRSCEFNKARPTNCLPRAFGQTNGARRMTLADSLVSIRRSQFPLAVA